MEKILKEKKYMVIAGVLVLVFLFYWFQVRPVSIKKNCSWVTETIKADPGVTKEQAEVNKKIYEKCVASEWDCDNPLGPGRLELYRNREERLAQPEKDEIKKATDKEYNQCLREHGL